MSYARRLQIPITINIFKDIIPKLFNHCNILLIHRHRQNHHQKRVQTKEGPQLPNLRTDPGHEIGSGLNWKRRALLERIYPKGVEEMAVTRKDRLCRFGSELVEKKMGHGSWFSVKNDSEYGLRSAANRRRRREAPQEV